MDSHKPEFFDKLFKCFICVCFYLDNSEKQNKNQITIANKEEWKRTHDVNSKLIHKTLLFIGAISALYLSTVWKSITADPSSKPVDGIIIPLPLATTFINLSVNTILFVAPIILAVTGMNLLIKVRHLDKLITPQNELPHPYLFNLDDPLARGATNFLFYWLVPAVLLIASVITYDSIEGKILCVFTLITFIVFCLFRIYWFKWKKPYSVISLVHYISIWMTFIIAFILIGLGIMEMIQFMIVNDIELW